MNCDCKSQVPEMFVRKHYSLSRRLEYARVILPIIGPDETIRLYYKAEAFTGFLGNVLDLKPKALKVYLASIDNRLSVIYAVQYTTDPDEDYYYTITRDEAHLLDTGTAKKFIKDYRSNQLVRINKAIQPPSGRGNTVAIFFKMKELQQFRDEVICQHATGIHVYFACYLETESGRAAGYERMLHVEYALTKTNVLGVEEDFYIDDCTDFGDRPGAGPDKDFNNGTLCPPCIDCANNSVPYDLEPESCKS